MSHSDTHVFAATAARAKCRGGEAGELGAALVVVGLSSERTSLTPLAYRSGSPLRCPARAQGRHGHRFCQHSIAGPTASSGRP